MITNRQLHRRDGRVRIASAEILVYVTFLTYSAHHSQPRVPGSLVVQGRVLDTAGWFTSAAALCAVNTTSGNSLGGRGLQQRLGFALQILLKERQAVGGHDPLHFRAVNAAEIRKLGGRRPGQDRENEREIGEVSVCRTLYMNAVQVGLIPKARNGSSRSGLNVSET